MPNCVIAGPYGKYIFSFKINSPTVFQSECTTLHLHQQLMSDPILTYPYHDYMLSLFFIWATVISLIMILNIFFVSLLNILIFSWEKCLLFFLPISNQIFLKPLSSKSSLCGLQESPLWNYMICKCSCSVCSLSFIIFTRIFSEQ